MVQMLRNRLIAEKPVLANIKWMNLCGAQAAAAGGKQLFLCSWRHLSNCQRRLRLDLSYHKLQLCANRTWPRGIDYWFLMFKLTLDLANTDSQSVSLMYLAFKRQGSRVAISAFVFCLPVVIAPPPAPPALRGTAAIAPANSDARSAFSRPSSPAITKVARNF